MGATRKSTLIAIKSCQLKLGLKYLRVRKTQAPFSHPDCRYTKGENVKRARDLTLEVPNGHY